MVLRRGWPRRFAVGLVVWRCFAVGLVVWRCCVVGLSVSEFLDEISVLFIIVCGMGGLSYKIFLSVWTFLKL